MNDRRPKGKAEGREGDSYFEWFEGNYQKDEADRHRRTGADVDQPLRIEYKPLVGQ